MNDLLSEYRLQQFHLKEIESRAFNDTRMWLEDNIDDLKQMAIDAPTNLIVTQRRSLGYYIGFYCGLSASLEYSYSKDTVRESMKAYAKKIVELYKLLDSADSTTVSGE